MIRGVGLTLVTLVFAGCSNGGSPILVDQGTVTTERDARADLRTRFVEYPIVWATVCSRSQQAGDSAQLALLATYEATLTPAPDKTELASGERFVQILNEECAAHWGAPRP